MKSKISRQKRSTKKGRHLLWIARTWASLLVSVNEVAEELGISIPFAYRIIRQMNEELAKTGCITIAGRIDRKFFHEKFYGTISETERKEK